jgi:hypothetical protein
MSSSPGNIELREYCDFDGEFLTLVDLGQGRVWI